MKIVLQLNAAAQYLRYDAKFIRTCRKNIISKIPEISRYADDRKDKNSETLRRVDECAFTF